MLPALQAAELPEYAPEVDYLWRRWQDMHAARGSGAMSPNPLSYVDIEAYARLLDEPFEPWEVRAVRAIDDAYMSSLSADDGGSG